MEKISIISKEVSGGQHAGYIKGSPAIMAVGSTPVEMVQNIIHATQVQRNQKKEKK